MEEKVAHAVTYRDAIIKEINDIPDEFIPVVLEEVKSFKNSLKFKRNTGRKSPTKRLLDLAGSLENPEKLSAKEYKRQAIEEYLSR